jgi:uncharacterized protein (TIGR02147 family)
MLSIFEFTNYCEYLSAWIESQGNKSHGIKGQIAKSLNVSSSFISQVLKSEKTFTSDQTSDLSDFLGLTEMESDYLHLMVELSRSGSHRYKEKLQRKIKKFQDQSKQIGNRVPRNKELTNEQKSIYYSSWLYTGIRNLTALADCKNINSLSKYLNIEPSVINQIVRFLIENGLCIDNSGKITYGPASIHIDKESPFVNKHHQNWRIKSIQQMDLKKENDLFFTGPMSLSQEAFDEILKLLPTVIQAVMKISGPSTSEVVACLNIDWFRY